MRALALLPGGSRGHFHAHTSTLDEHARTPDSLAPLDAHSYLPLRCEAHAGSTSTGQEQPLVGANAADAMTPASTPLLQVLKPSLSPILAHAQPDTCVEEEGAVQVRAAAHRCDASGSSAPCSALLAGVKTAGYPPSPSPSPSQCTSRCRLRYLSMEHCSKLSDDVFAHLLNMPALRFVGLSR